MRVSSKLISNFICLCLYFFYIYNKTAMCALCRYDKKYRFKPISLYLY